MADFNADPTSRKYVLGVADGLLAHAKTDAKGELTLPDDINWRTEETRGVLPVNTPAMQLLWGAYRLECGDAKYEQPPLAADAHQGGARATTEFNENMMDALGKRQAWSADAAKRGSGANASNFDRYMAWQADGDRMHLEDLRRRGNPHSPTSTTCTCTPKATGGATGWKFPSEIPAADAAGRRRAEAQLDLAGRDGELAPSTGSEAAEQVAILMPGATPSHFLSSPSTPPTAW